MPSWRDLIERQAVVITDTDSIYTQFNPYGFLFNINHPAINRAYLNFKCEIGENLYPLSDADRHEFEMRIATGHYPEIDKYLRK